MLMALCKNGAIAFQNYFTFQDFYEPLQKACVFGKLSRNAVFIQLYWEECSRYIFLEEGRSVYYYQVGWFRKKDFFHK